MLKLTRIALTQAYFGSLYLVQSRCRPVVSPVDRAQDFCDMGLEGAARQAMLRDLHKRMTLHLASLTLQALEEGLQSHPESIILQRSEG